MAAIPSSIYHRWLGWHAPAMRRLAVAGSIGLTVCLALLAPATWELALAVVNTVFTLRYADIFFSLPAEGIDFGGAGESEAPSYRDFAYLAFTIGMTYQVSDTTLRDRRLRRAVLNHALLSYVFGVVIVATSINLIAGLVR